MNFNSDFDLKKAKSFLLTENKEDYGTNALTGKPLPKPDPVVEVEEYRMGIFDDIDADLMEEEDRLGYLDAIIKYCTKQMEDVGNDNGGLDDTESLDEVLENDDIIYDRLVDMDHEQLVSTLLRTAEDNPSITLEKFLNEYGFSEDEELNENQLEEMAKISGDLKSAIEKVIAANTDLQGLSLKKAIKGDAAVIDALDGEDLYDNQLNKFIALSKGERTVGQRGRVANPNKPAAAPKAEKSPKIKITTPKAAATPSSKLADLAPTSVFGLGEEDEEDIAAEKQATGACAFASTKFISNKTAKINLKNFFMPRANLQLLLSN
jgi:hypothetical protein